MHLSSELRSAPPTMLQLPGSQSLTPCLVQTSGSSRPCLLLRSRGTSYRHQSRQTGHTGTCTLPRYSRGIDRWCWVRRIR